MRHTNEGRGPLARCMQVTGLNMINRQTNSLKGATVALASFLTGAALLALSGQAWSQLACDPSTQDSTRSGRFRIDELTGMVLDTKTNLTWKRCAEGQRHSAGKCQGEALQSKWLDGVSMFGMRGDGWRLPNIDELLSIVEAPCGIHSINVSAFPDTPAHTFWTASEDVKNNFNAWYVNFWTGASDTDDKDRSSHIRLVRGAQWTKADEKRLLEEAQRVERERKLRVEALVVRSAEELQKAEDEAVIACPNKITCEKAFTLTEVYIAQSADMKIQVATGTTIETHTPTEDGKVGLKALKIPGKGTSAKIALTATCKDETGRYSRICVLAKFIAYRGFRPYIDKMMTE